MNDEFKQVEEETNKVDGLDTSTDTTTDALDRPAEVVEGVDVEKVSKLEKSGAKYPIIFGSVLVASVLVGGTLAYALNPVARNSFTEFFKSDDDYCEWVLENNKDGIVENLNSKIDELESMHKFNTASFGVKYTLSDEVRDLIKTSGIDQYIADSIDNVNSVGFDVTAQTDTSLQAFDGSLKVNDSEIVGANLVGAMEEYKYAFNLKELNEDWLGCIVDEETMESLGDSISGVLAPNGKTDYDLKKFVSCADKYAGLFINCIDDVEVNKEDSSIFNQKMYVLEYTVDEDFLKELGDEIVPELRKDDVVKELFLSTQGSTEEDYELWVDDIEESLENAVIESTDNVIVRTYVNAEGKIKGIIAVDEENKYNWETDKRLGFTSVENSENANTVETNFYLGDTSCVLTSKKDSSTGLSTGNLSYHYTKYYWDYETSETKEIESVIDIGFEKFGMVDKERFLHTGKVSVSSDGSKLLEVNLGVSDKKQLISSDIVVDDVNYGNVELSFVAEDSDSLAMPAGVEYLPVEEVEAGITEYINADEFIYFVADKLESIGIIESKADLIQYVEDYQEEEEYYNQETHNDVYDYEDWDYYYEEGYDDPAYWDENSYDGYEDYVYDDYGWDDLDASYDEDYVDWDLDDDMNYEDIEVYVEESERVSKELQEGLDEYNLEIQEYLDNYNSLIEEY